MNSSTGSSHKEIKRRRKKEDSKTLSERSKTYRIRKKMYIQNLEQKVILLEKENKELKEQIEDLKEAKLNVEPQVFLNSLFFSLQPLKVAQINKGLKAG